MMNSLFPVATSKKHSVKYLIAGEEKFMSGMIPTEVGMERISVQNALYQMAPITMWRTSPTLKARKLCWLDLLGCSGDKHILIFAHTPIHNNKWKNLKQVIWQCS